jgi:hypothetical protein
MRLLIGIPTYGHPRSEFAIDSLGKLLFHIGRRHPEFTKVGLHRDVRTYRQSARQAIVDDALENDYTHLLMLDDDHVFDGQTFTKLWEGMQSRDDVHLISALYFTRGRPTCPCIWKLTSEGTVPVFYYPEDQLFEVDVVGFGFVLFDLTLFKEGKISPPWFDLGRGFGEDAVLCTRFLQNGYKVWTHTGAKIGHIFEQPTILDEEMYLQEREYAIPQDPTGKLTLIGTEDRLLTHRPPVRIGTKPWWNPNPSRIIHSLSDLCRGNGGGKGNGGGRESDHEPEAVGATDSGKEVV